MPQSITDFIPLEEIDADGALSEGAEALEGDSRADFFRRAGVMGAGLATSGLLLGGLPELASASGLAKSDIKILQYALTLEYLESTFYTEAQKHLIHKLPTKLAQLTDLVRRHEDTHVAALRKTLGKHTIKKPKFNFHGTTLDVKKYRNTAFVLENTGVHAYLGQAAKIKNKKVLAAAAEIVTIEARHASAFGLLAHSAVKGKQGITPSGPFDTPLSMGVVTDKKHAGHFLA